jgi:transcriptional regulator with XRE-family HTH domain
VTGTPQAAENPRGMTHGDDTLWTQEQVAEYLGVSPRTVEGWRRRGTGPSWHRVGRFPRYFRRDVLAWVRRHRGDGHHHDA